MSFGSAATNRRFVDTNRAQSGKVSFESESGLRIERYARVLAPGQQAARIAAISQVLAVARGVHAAAPAFGGTVHALAPDCPDSSATSHGDRIEGQMMRHLCEVGDFVRRLRIQARFGELSRARLCLLRVQLCGEYAECDWIARPSDPWDADLPTLVGKRNASTQALHDAIKIRGLLFRSLPDLQKAELRGFRYSPDESLELILSGTVSRDVRAPARVRSLAMKAKLFGFRFWMEEGILESLQVDRSDGGSNCPAGDDLVYGLSDRQGWV